MLRRGSMAHLPRLRFPCSCQSHSGDRQLCGSLRGSQHTYHIPVLFRRFEFRHLHTVDAGPKSTPIIFFCVFERSKIEMMMSPIRLVAWWFYCSSGGTGARMAQWATSARDADTGLLPLRARALAANRGTHAAVIQWECSVHFIRAMLLNL